MESIKEFIKQESNFNHGYGDGKGDGYGEGRGDGYSCGCGYDNCDDDFYSGYGDGSGYGYSSGYCSGYGDGDGDGYGHGYGDGYDRGVKSINGKKVYLIDLVPTIIDSIRNNIAKGFILQKDFTLSSCFIVKENNTFSHGKTLHEAFLSLQEKIYDDETEEERIEKFKNHFKDFSLKYPAKELFIWHHILTGSCKAGRESFVKDHNINLEKDKFTIYDFIELTQNSYNGDIIKKLINLKL